MKRADQLINAANCGYVGINDKLEVSSGYDQAHDGADAVLPGYWDADDGDVRMPAVERVLLADEMIIRWQRYRLAAAAEIVRGDDA